MRYQFLNGEYNGERDSIDTWVRGEDGTKRLLYITGFEAYMYVPEGEVAEATVREDWIKRIEEGYVAKDGTKLTKIVVTDPLKVRDHRGEFSQAYEADIRFVNRMLIDTGIRSCFNVDTRSAIVPYDDLVPESGVIPPHVVYVDIETRSTGRFPNVRNPVDPVISVTFWDTKHRRYLTIIVDRRYGSGVSHNREPDWMVIYVSNPDELTAKAIEYLRFVKADIVTGWNIDFDIGYFNAWLKFNKKPHLPMVGAEQFDLLSAYKKVRPSLGNRLKEVVIREGIATEAEMVAKEFHIEQYLNTATRDDFILYNKMDVEYCVKLDRGFENVKTGKWVQYDIILNFWQRKNFAGLSQINSTLTHAQRHDMLWLRDAHEQNIVLPSNPTRKGQSELDYGGVVFQPRPAIFEKITVLDMSRYYPSIILSFPEETSPDIWGKIGPSVIGKLSSERDYWDTELAKYEPGSDEWKTAKVTHTVVKHFLSGAWGFFAYPGSRIYDPDKGNFVLKTAGDGLRRMDMASRRAGHEPVYGDTDSIFIRSELDEVDNLVEVLNNELEDWADDMGVSDNRFNIKEDRYAGKTLFIRGDKKDVGVKKRYAQHVIREDQQLCDYLLIKGFDYVRGNTSEVTRAVQHRVLDSVLRTGTEGLMDYIRTEIEKIRSGEYSLDDITIPVNLSKPFEEVKSGEYYKGAFYNNAHIGENIVPGDLVRFFKVAGVRVGGWPSTSWISYIDKANLPLDRIDVDYDWIIDRTVRSTTERILEAVGITWHMVMGAEDLDSVFG